MMPPCRNAPVMTVHGCDISSAGTSARSSLVVGASRVTTYMKMQIAIIA